jgi:hypothetical protein
VVFLNNSFETRSDQFGLFIGKGQQRML